MVFCGRLYLTTLPRVDAARMSNEKWLRDLHVDISGRSLISARVGDLVASSLWACCSLVGRTTVQSTSSMLGGRPRQHETNLSKMYTDQNARRCSSCSEASMVESGSTFNLKPWAKRIAKPIFTHPRRC